LRAWTTAPVRESDRTRVHGLGRLGEHAQNGHLAQRAHGIEVEDERALERRERELVGAQGALERVASQPLDQLGSADDDPRLRPAEQLVAGEADEVGSRRERLARRRLALERHEHARAEVVHERQSVLRREDAVPALAGAGIPDN